MNMDNRRAHEQILRYIEKHGVPNKDAAPQAKSRQSGRGKRSSRALRHGTEIDLHGMTRTRAAHVLRTTIQRGRQNGVRSVLVIHGQGLHSEAEEGAVLKELVRMMLDGECRALVRSYKTAPPHKGGDGATIVYLH